MIFQANMVRLSTLLRERGLRLCTAESCTGGGFAKACTDLPESSEWFEGGFVVYSEAAKQAVLDVAQDVLQQHGIVSEETALMMAHGALQKMSCADISAAVTGLAGPGGGSAQTPIGHVCFAWQRRGEPGHAATQRFSGDRAAIRSQSIQTLIAGVLTLLDEG